MDNNDRKLLETYLRKIVAEAINYQSNVGKEKDKNPSKTHSNKNNDKLLKQMLQDPKINQAEIMRQLWHPEDEDAARSKFSKKVRGALNDDGVPYDFTDDEKTELFKILRGNK